MTKRAGEPEIEAKGIMVLRFRRAVGGVSKVRAEGRGRAFVAPESCG